MLSEFLARTPPWVFVIFFALLALGIVQSRTRQLNRTKVLVLPIAMVGFSFFGVWSAFSLNLASMLAWVVGLMICALLAVRWVTPAGVVFSAPQKRYTVPGSWLPLALMMAIFATKYVVGASFSMELAITGYPFFMMVVSVLYGAFSGLFLARATGILRVVR